MRLNSTRFSQRGNARATSLGIFLVLAGVGGLMMLNQKSEGPEAPPDPATQEPGELPDAKGPDWELPTGAAQPPGGAPDFDEPDPVTEPTLVFPGTEAVAGETVQTLVPYRKGDRNHYKLTNTVRGENKQSGNARGRRETRWLTTEVVNVDKTGGARVSVTFDALRVQMLLSAEFGFAFDSRAPDPEVMSDPRIATLIGPQLALLHVPVEFELAADGTPVRVHNWEEYAEKFKDAVRALSKNPDLAFAPSEEQLLRDLGGLIFPSVGRELVVGEGRKYERLEDTSVRYDIRHAGTIDVTRSDPGVCVVELVATPEIVRRTGQPRSDNESRVVEGHIVADGGSSTGKWRIDRKARRLERAELRASYELWISFKGGPGNPEMGVGKDFTPTFTVIDQLTTLEYVAAPADEKAGKDPKKDTDQGAAPPAQDTEQQASGTDQPESTGEK